MKCKDTAPVGSEEDHQNILCSFSFDVGKDNEQTALSYRG
jgi:hypothetical protein